MPPESTATSERQVRPFRKGRNQAGRILRGFELPGSDAIIRRERNKLGLEAGRPKSLLALLATLEPIEEDFSPLDDAPPGPIDI